MRHKEFWIALGVGAAIGGIAALLYAPQTGTATRKKLSAVSKISATRSKTPANISRTRQSVWAKKPRSSSTPARTSSTMPSTQRPTQ